MTCGESDAIIDSMIEGIDDHRVVVPFTAIIPLPQRLDHFNPEMGTENGRVDIREGSIWAFE